MKTESASRPFDRKTKAKAKKRKELKRRALEEYDRIDGKIGEGTIAAADIVDSSADSSSQKERDLRKRLDEIEAQRMRDKSKDFAGGGEVRAGDVRFNNKRGMTY
tara:strand:+ start:1069 stop:1383 length:315 start_codon:yes stop_codon:yes gene_type:complete